MVLHVIFNFSNFVFFNVLLSFFLYYGLGLKSVSIHYLLISFASLIHFFNI